MVPKIRVVSESDDDPNADGIGNAGGIWSGFYASTSLPSTDERVRLFLKALKPIAQFEDSTITQSDFYPGCSMESHHLAYVTCHGNKYGPVMDSGPALDRSQVKWGSAGSLKWLICDMCYLLGDPSTALIWSPCFSGLRYLLGFASISSDLDQGLRGQVFAHHLCAGAPFRDAWRWATQETGEWLGDTLLQPAWLRAYDPNNDTSNDSWLANPQLPTLPADNASLSFELLQHYAQSVDHGVVPTP